MENKIDNWPVPPEQDRIELPVWTVRPLGDRVRMRNATYEEAARFSSELVSRGFRNVWVYPEETVYQMTSDKEKQNRKSFP